MFCLTAFLEPLGCNAGQQNCTPSMETLSVGIIRLVAQKLILNQKVSPQSLYQVHKFIIAPKHPRSVRVSLWVSGMSCLNPLISLDSCQAGVLVQAARWGYTRHHLQSRGRQRSRGCHCRAAVDKTRCLADQHCCVLGGALGARQSKVFGKHTLNFVRRGCLWMQSSKMGLRWAQRAEHERMVPQRLSLQSSYGQDMPLA